MTTTTVADPLPNCDTKLKTCIEKCDKMRLEKNKEIELGDLALQKCQETSAHNITENKELHDKLQSPLRNPFFMGLLGIVAGGTAAMLLFRK